MLKRGIMAKTCVAALALAAIFAVPAIGAPGKLAQRRGVISEPRGTAGIFTPAAADPRLAAIYGSGLRQADSGFRFTPVSRNKPRAVTVAVRASRSGQAVLTDHTIPAASSAEIGITPVAYNLGMSVGWKRFALSGDVGRVNSGALPGSREAADLGISYNARKWSSRVQVTAERPAGTAPRTINGTESYALDVASSYRLTRNLDVTAGVRYKSDRNRLQDVADKRRDSQAVYVGTAFKF